MVGARVLECSTLAVVDRLDITQLQKDCKIQKQGRGRKQVVLSNYFLSGGEVRLSGLFYSHADCICSTHRICAVSENKNAPVFSFDLFDLARKTANTFTLSSGSHRSCVDTSLVGQSFSQRGLEQSIKGGKENEQSEKREPRFKATTFVLDAPKRQVSLRQPQHQIWKTLHGGLRRLDAACLGPVPPFTGSLIALLGFVLILGVILDRWIGRASKGVQLSNVRDAQVQTSELPKAPTGLSLLVERDLKKKESVEWVNMVLGKLWKIYRLGLESWLVGLLQPLIDNLKKPDYVERVQIKQFYLGDEPIAVRSVERRASRRVNDIQYHIGLRYTGGARMLLLLKLRVGFIPLSIPVGVRGLDVDGELWVKLRLVPCEPWVGTATWAFVSLPKIKLDLSPFRLFNLMAIPFLSIFLTNLLTQDLPRLFVRPNKNVIDFLQGKAVGPVPKDFKGATLEGNKDFSGELSVTLVDARKLSYVPYGKTDPYVVLILGDQVIRSKKNSQTSVVGPPGGPIWNQDFQLLVVDPKTQQLAVRVRDYFGLTAFTVGAGEVELNALQDTVPADRVVRLTGGWGPFRKRFAGEILLRLTYTAYVEEEDEERRGDVPLSASSRSYSMEDNGKPALPLVNELAKKAVESLQEQSSMTDMFAAVIADLGDENPGDSWEALSEDGWEANDDGDGGSVRPENSPRESPDLGASVPGNVSQGTREGTALVWLGLLTGLAFLVAISLNFSNLMNP